MRSMSPRSRPPCAGEGDPTATGLDGLRAVQVALAVREAAGSGQRVSITD